jgi:hypothetical protein
VPPCIAVEGLISQDLSVSQIAQNCANDHMGRYVRTLHLSSDAHQSAQSVDNWVIGAGDEIRTHDPNLGKVVLLPLSYAPSVGYGRRASPLPESRGKPHKAAARKWVSPA